MSECVLCHNEIDEENEIDEDTIDELHERADALGMESLTENEQFAVDSDVCNDCLAV